jgi:type IV secretion system protein VirB10
MDLRRLPVAPFCTLLVCSALFSQDPAAPAAEPAAPKPRDYQVEPGTKIPLSLINSVSSKNAAEGDRVYLETAFPIVGEGRILIPPGSYVAGTVTQVKRAGRIKGKAELFIRFDSLTLPNGVTRDFRARVSGMDGQTGQTLDRREGRITGEGNKGGDARSVGETAVTGTWIGTVAGSAAGRPGMGAGLGAAAGAAAGMVGVLLSRGPEAVLPKGTTVEMVLDRALLFSEGELEFGYTPKKSYAQPVAAPAQETRGGGLSRRRLGQIP